VAAACDGRISAGGPKGEGRVVVRCDILSQLALKFRYTRHIQPDYDTQRRTTPARGATQALNGRLCTVTLGRGRFRVETVARRDGLDVCPQTAKQ